MPKKATVVFIQVKVSALDELAIALRKRSLELASGVSCAYEMEDQALYQAFKLQQADIDRVLGEVLKKQRQHR